MSACLIEIPGYVTEPGRSTGLTHRTSGSVLPGGRGGGGLRGRISGGADMPRNGR